ncbi:transporter, NhaC family [Dethiosulfatibacter aminovorans DSM 17477]|uniref:Transporter, NhaC family n=1 Tax=Dethiosulfatibacter aminovorans DSM 17477 TaxID=1121476 RepID=A0A1M6ICW7_9FIRM|nr:Na+/H+ antiporter NhaC family protein [Dethiosulfatibacter aminovorans]SHJ32247.1 transporter, NhaC family [Dethiosulfatibacter aminovorans DSM 17477]
MDYGWLAVLPPLVAIILCFVTKRVLISLFAGIFTGAIIISGGNPLAAAGYSLETIVAQVTDDWNARLLLFNLLMGAGIAYIWRLNGSKALTDWARTKIKTKKGASVGAWLLGIIVFFNDYCNAAIVGNVFRDISEEHKLSSEKLSYILDSTAAPVATFFISDWIAFQIGMIGSGMEVAGITTEQITPFAAYVSSIPLNLYCIFAVIFVGIVSFTGRDFGPMLKAETRAVREGKINRDGASPMMDVGTELGEPVKDAVPKISTFFIPIISLIVVTLIGFYYTGLSPETQGMGLMEILGAADAATALLWGAFAMTLSGIVMALGTRTMNVKDTMDSLIDGMKLMLLACIILTLAWSLGSITGDMDLAGFIVTLLGDSLSFAMIPIVIFLFGMGISFATGTSWGTMTILTPIAIPLTYKVTGDYQTAVMMAGVVFSGAIFGDHCSPISDTTVLASIFASADHIDHVSTQIPYALLTAATALLMYIIYGVAGISPLVLIPVGIALMTVALYVVGKNVDEVAGVKAKAN